MVDDLVQVLACPRPRHRFGVDALHHGRHGIAAFEAVEEAVALERPRCLYLVPIAEDFLQQYRVGISGDVAVEAARVEEAGAVPPRLRCIR